MQLELRIEKVAHGGVFVARPEGKVVLVTGALEGELVRAEVTEEADRFLRAEVVEVLEPSKHRVENFWDLGSSVGGVEFGHIALSHQRELKAKVLTEALERMAGITREVVVRAIDETGLHYRRRVQLHADAQGRLGVKRRRSHEIVPIKNHPLATLELNDSGLFARRYPGMDRIEFAIDDLGNLSSNPTTEGSAQRLHYRAGQRNFSLQPGTFWQAHTSAPESLVTEVIAQLNSLGEHSAVLDLYSGAGLFAANIAQQLGAEVLAVENSPTAVADGKRSAKDLANLQFVKSDVLQYLRQQRDIPGTVVMDPPRSGAAGKVVSQVIRLKPQRIVYVACDPVALARDLKLFSEGGYELVALEAFDIFPQTHHFETVVSLRLTNL